MRTVLFYSGVESFNYYTDQLFEELTRRQHEIFILDLRNPEPEDPHSYVHFEQFLKQPVDLAVCYDSFGFKNDAFIDLWNEQGTVLANIMVDHPLRFHPTMSRHPDRYVQFCVDRNHVAYVKKYFADEVEHVEFMPHAGSCQKQERNIPFSERKYDILFSGTYYRPQDELAKINQWYPEGSAMDQFYHCMAEYMLSNSSLPAEQAALDTISRLNMQVSDQTLKTIFRCSEPLDWMARMYHRGRVIQTLAESGMELWLLGRGWENHPSAGLSNVHRIDDRIPFADTMPYIEDAKVCVNVMPWFKSGSHERILNILLHHSLPLTDYSSWVDENFKADEEVVFYDLDHLEQLPEIVKGLLADEERTTAIIQKGYEKVLKHHTWVNRVDQILKAVQEV